MEMKARSALMKYSSPKRVTMMADPSTLREEWLKLKTLSSELTISRVTSPSESEPASFCFVSIWPWTEKEWKRMVLSEGYSAEKRSLRAWKKASMTPTPSPDMSKFALEISSVASQVKEVFSCSRSSTIFTRRTRRWV